MKDGVGQFHARGADEAREAGEARPAGATAGDEECDLCGARMYGLHCKLVCPNCGYRRDCSDP